MKKLRCIAVVMLSCVLVLTGIRNYGFADELSDAEKEKQRLEDFLRHGESLFETYLTKGKFSLQPFLQLGCRLLHSDVPMQQFNL